MGHIKGAVDRHVRRSAPYVPAGELSRRLVSGAAGAELSHSPYRMDRRTCAGGSSASSALHDQFEETIPMVATAHSVSKRVRYADLGPVYLPAQRPTDSGAQMPLTASHC